MEHTINLPQQEMAFDSLGYNAFISLDLSDDHYRSLFRAENGHKIKDNHEVLVGNMAIKSVGSAAHYAINDAWYLSLFYDKWQDSIQAHNKKHHLKVYDEYNHSKSYTASLGWGKEIGSYYLSLSTTMSQTDWQSERAVSISKKHDLAYFAKARHNSRFIGIRYVAFCFIISRYCTDVWRTA